MPLSTNISLSKRPLKRFGQNFLTSPHLRQKIVSALEISGTDCVLEIGPGKGALSEYIIAAKPKKFWAVEIDRRWSDALKIRFPSKLTLIEDDFLQTDLDALFTEAGKRLKIIGNIPYNITSPILFKLIEHFRQIECAVLMVQKEVALRINASPNNKEYGILSVVSQTYAEVKYLFTVKSGNFFPVPAVDSAVIRLDFFRELAGIENEKRFRGIVRQVFNYRRKMLRNSLSRIFTKSVVNSLNPSFLNVRPEALSVEAFKKLSNELNQISGRTHG